MRARGPDALLLDEMFSHEIAAQLTSREVDCRAVNADPVLRSLTDLEIFETALLEGRVLVTNNVADFESLRRAREAAGGVVPGLIYTSDATFPRTRAYVIRLAAALETAARGHETAQSGGVLWLRAADSLRSRVVVKQRAERRVAAGRPRTRREQGPGKFRAGNGDAASSARPRGVPDGLDPAD